MEAPCPSCGNETEGYGPRGLCRDCFLDEEDLIEVPDGIEVERCNHCGRVRLGMDWVEAGGAREMISKVLENEMDTEPVKAVSFQESGNEYSLQLLVDEEVEGERLQQDLETRIVVENSQCDVCSKFEGGYHEYKIQLRGGEMEEVLGEVMDRAAEVTNENRKNFVSDVEEVDGGYDLYLSSREMAEALLRVVREGYDMEEKRSKELIGEEEGQKVYRSVVSARVI